MTDIHPTTQAAIAEYNATEQALTSLRQQYAGIQFEVASTTGMKLAIAARAELRDYRVNLEKKRVEIKAPALERARLIDAEAKRITTELLTLEEPIDAQIKAEESRKAAEKQAKIEAERQRVAGLQAMVDLIRNNAAQAVGQSSEQIAQIRAGLAMLVPSSDLYHEFVAMAVQARAETLEKLNALYDAKLADEAEQTRIAAERQELERYRREEQARLAAEQERIAREREQQEREDAERRAKADEEARLERERLAAEQEQQARQRREQEDRERAERERAEQEERERRGREMAEAAAKRDAEAKALAEERERLHREAEALEAKRLADELANVTLTDAAQTALDFLIAQGYCENKVTKMLAAALSRTPETVAA